MTDARLRCRAQVLDTVISSEDSREQRERGKQAATDDWRTAQKAKKAERKALKAKAKAKLVREIQQENSRKRCHQPPTKEQLLPAPSVQQYISSLPTGSAALFNLCLLAVVQARRNSRGDAQCRACGTRTGE
eukprot:SAG25_NODE_1157_length_3752_cov_1.837394_4_plen_132_part_00